MEYSGHVAEHLATRKRVTLCDVSHMGELDFRGPDALTLVQKLITNDASRIVDGRALYSVMCNEAGMVIDDLVCLRLSAEHFVWVVNVTKTDEDYLWVLKQARGLDVAVRNVSTDTALMALQGPESREVLQRISKADLTPLQYYRFVQTTLHTEHAAVPCIVSRTGYVGERGYEIMVERDLAMWVWDALLAAGRPLGIMPHGVAARESLRTEAGYLLNGNDMDSQTNPYEAGLGWVVKLEKDFIGRDALAAIKQAGVARQLVGIEMDGQLTIRNGYAVLREGKEIGRVRSGPLSPALCGRNLGLGYVAAEHSRVDTEIEVDVRGKRCKGRIVALPFSPRRVRDEPATAAHSPYGLRFSAAHVWARVDDSRKDTVALGLTDYGQRMLGEILCVDLPKLGTKVAKGGAAGWVDTYRKPLDILSPVDGEIVEVNESLLARPAQINAYPYDARAIVKLRAVSMRDLEALMSFEQYVETVRGLRSYDAWTG